jgi:hypothetical protein
MTNLTLRAATPADIPTLHRLMRDFAVHERIEHRFYLTEASLHEALFAPRPLIESVLADSGNTTLGFALWLVFFAPSPADAACSLTIYLSPNPTAAVALA